MLVTGRIAGNVGSMAIRAVRMKSWLQGFAASRGRPELHQYLRGLLEPQEILNRTTLATPSKRPLDSERWAAAIDSVGGETLAAVLHGRS